MKRNKTQVLEKFSTIFLLHPLTACREQSSMLPLGLQRSKARVGEI
jgi:hypothetical protein